MNIDEISKLELDLLLVFYTFADQWGNVDMQKVSNFARSKMNIFIKVQPFVFTQKHMDILIKYKLVPDVLAQLNTINNKKANPQKADK